MSRRDDREWIEEMFSFHIDPDPNTTNRKDFVNGLLEVCAAARAEGRQTAREELATLKAQIDLAWQYIENGWDIEPRAYFEKEAPTNGFGSPLAQAAHHVWKREPRVQKLTDEISRLQPYVQQMEALIEKWNTRYISGCALDEAAKRCATELGGLIPVPSSGRSKSKSTEKI